MQAYINENMQTQAANPAAFNTTGKLYTRKGALVRSFVPGQPGNIFNVKRADEKGLVIDFGTSLPYASIHEYGGKIKSSPRMIGYFWAMYKQTQLKFFKILALAARKNGGFTIKARPYFAPAVRKFEKDGVEFLQRNLFINLEKAWNG